MSQLLKQFIFKSLFTFVKSGPFSIKERKLAKMGRTESVLRSDILNLNSLF